MAPSYPYITYLLLNLVPRVFVALDQRVGLRETRDNAFSDNRGAIHSTKLSGNFGPKLNGSVRSNRKSFEKTGPPFEVVLFSRSDRLELWLNGSRPRILVIPAELRRRERVFQDGLLV